MCYVEKMSSDVDIGEGFWGSFKGGGFILNLYYLRRVRWKYEGQLPNAFMRCTKPSE